MVGLQGPWGERFRGTCLDDFSLRHACRATEESVLDKFLCFGVVAALILARPAGPLGRAFWRCIFGWLLARPKLYHHYGLQGKRSWPQDGSNAAIRQPTWRLLFCVRVAMVELQGHWGERFRGTCLDGFSLRHACRPTGESVLEKCLCFGVVAALILARPAGPLGRALRRCIFGWLLARPKLYHHYGP